MKFSIGTIATIPTLFLWVSSLEGVHGELRQRKETRNSDGETTTTTRKGRGRRNLSEGKGGKTSKAPKAPKAPKKSKGEGKGTGICFPGDAKVEVYDDLTDTFVEEKMEDVRIGDELKCIDEDTNELGRCEVFLHWHPSTLFPDTNEVYQKIKHSEGDITISEDHMIYLAPTSTPDGTTIPTLPPLTGDNFEKAAEVEVGDKVLVADDEGNLVAREVEENKLISKDTFYAPLVKGGKLFVDDVLASSYVIFDSRGTDAINGGDTAHYTLNAYYNYVLNLIETQQIDTSGAFGKTRDEPDYVAWEAQNYVNVTFPNFGVYYQALRSAQFISNQTLTSEEAIRFEAKVREEIAADPNGFTAVDLASLYTQAVFGTDPLILT